MKEFIYGRNPVHETLRANRRQILQLLLAEGLQEKSRLDEILELARKRKIPVVKIPRQRLERINDSNQGIAMEVGEYPYAHLRDILNLAEARNQPLFVLILDSLQNPQNLGTLIRTAESVGVHGVVIASHRAAEITPAVVSASAGACEHMLIAQSNLAQAISELKQVNTWVVGLDEGPESLPLEEVRLVGALAIVVGNEGEGLRALVRKQCDILLRLPMQGEIASLNAAVAGSVVLYLSYLARNPGS
jgi:23S rRNA (guanosine2251-2'-O)-methyltransferase